MKGGVAPGEMEPTARLAIALAKERSPLAGKNGVGLPGLVTFGSVKAPHHNWT
jgi:hypothetical protein